MIDLLETASSASGSAAEIFSEFNQKKLDVVELGLDRGGGSWMLHLNSMPIC